MLLPLLFRTPAAILHISSMIDRAPVLSAFCLLRPNGMGRGRGAVLLLLLLLCLAAAVFKPLNHMSAQAQIPTLVCELCLSRPAAV